MLEVKEMEEARLRREVKEMEEERLRREAQRLPRGDSNSVEATNESAVAEGPQERSSLRRRGAGRVGYVRRWSAARVGAGRYYTRRSGTRRASLPSVA